MKVFYHDAVRDPTGWQQMDAADWIRLPKRPVPRSGELGGVDNEFGWVQNLSICGLTVEGYDHVAILPIVVGQEEGTKLWTWNDDPEDYPLGFRVANVWTILPLAPDPNLGGAINTRQSCVRYAEGARYAKLIANTPQNTIVRPWSDFVAPPEALTRHGIWLAPEKWAEHIAAAPQSRAGWRLWVDHLPDSEVDVLPDGTRKLKVQRALGRWKKAAGTITYIQRNTDRVADWLTATHEDALELTTATAVTESVTTNADLILSWGFSSPANEPNSIAWDGIYNTQLDCTAASAGLVYMCGDIEFVVRARWFRLASNLATFLEDEVEDKASFSGTGLKLATSGSEVWTNPAADNRFGFFVYADGDSHADAITLELNTADSYADGPWAAAALPDGRSDQAQPPPPIRMVRFHELTNLLPLLFAGQDQIYAGPGQVPAYEPAWRIPPTGRHHEPSPNPWAQLTLAGQDIFYADPGLAPVFEPAHRIPPIGRHHEPSPSPWAQLLLIGQDSFYGGPGQAPAIEMVRLLVPPHRGAREEFTNLLGTVLAIETLPDGRGGESLPLRTLYLPQYRIDDMMNLLGTVLGVETLPDGRSSESPRFRMFYLPRNRVEDVANSLGTILVVAETLPDGQSSDRSSARLVRVYMRAEVQLTGLNNTLLEEIVAAGIPLRTLLGVGT